MSNKPPIEVPQGAIRLNTDSQKLEFFAQDRWYEMATNTPTLDGGTRGIFFGENPSSSNVIQFITIDTQGNATDFGDLLAMKNQGASCASRTRGIYGGGEAPSALNTIEFVTISSTGNATDFGDMTDQRRRMGDMSLSNQTRGLFFGGYDGTSGGTLNLIDYITIATTGNAADFGDSADTNNYTKAGCSDSGGGLGGF